MKDSGSRLSGQLATLVFIIGAIAIAGCFGPKPAPFDSGARMAAIEGHPTVWVGKPSMWACDNKCEPLYDAAMELEKAGVHIVDSTAGRLDSVFCKACFTCPSGEYNFVKMLEMDLNKLPENWSVVEENLIIRGEGCR